MFLLKQYRHPYKNSVWLKQLFSLGAEGWMVGWRDNKSISELIIKDEKAFKILSDPDHIFITQYTYIEPKKDTCQIWRDQNLFLVLLAIYTYLQGTPYVGILEWDTQYKPVVRKAEEEFLNQLSGFRYRNFIFRGFNIICIVLWLHSYYQKLHNYHLVVPPDQRPISQPSYSPIFYKHLIVWAKLH